MNQVADRIDLAIDLLTLGQYGLETIEPERDAPTDPCGSRRRHRRSPRGPAPRSQAERRRGRGHGEHEWGWPSRDADSGPSPASSLWAMAHA